MILKIVNIILIAALFFAGAETIIRIKQNENKPIEEIRKSLIIRIDTIIALTIAVAVTTVINIIINNT